MHFKHFLIFLAFVSQINTLQVHAAEHQRQRFHAGPVYKNEDNSYGIVIELPIPFSIQDLSHNNIKLSIDGSEIDASLLNSFKNSEEKLAWLIAVDVSGSMAGNPLKDIKDSLLSLLSDRRNLRVGLITFGNVSNIEFGIENEEESKQLTDAILGLKDHGSRSKTRLYNALHETLELFEEASKKAEIPLRQRILVISDGKDEGSDVNIQSVIDRSKGLGIPIDTVGKGRIEPQYLESLRMLAEGTGGYFVHAAPDRLSLSDALKRIYGMLMELQTAIAYFSYETNETELSHHATVIIELPATKLVSLPLDVQLPIPNQVTSPKLVNDEASSSSIWNSSLIWLLVLTVVLATVIIIAKLRSSSSVLTKTDSKHFADKTNDKSTVVRESVEKNTGVAQREKKTVVSEVRRETVVGGLFAIPQLNKPSAVLVGLEGGLQNQKIGVNKDLFFIGAGADNDLSIPDDQYISTKHACIRFENGSFYILDQDSTNGTFVNDERIGNTACLLVPGSRIRLGDSIFEMQKVAV